MTVPPHELSVNTQQTPNPEAQFPPLVPPAVEHSELVMQVPEVEVVETPVQVSCWKFNAFQTHLLNMLMTPWSRHWTGFASEVAVQLH